VRKGRERERGLFQKGGGEAPGRLGERFFP